MVLSLTLLILRLESLRAPSSDHSSTSSSPMISLNVSMITSPGTIPSTTPTVMPVAIFVVSLMTDIKFEITTDYMAKNKLVIISDKTHLLVISTSRNQKKHGDYGNNLDTGNEIIEPVNKEKLLGCIKSSNPKFNNHIRDNEKSMSNILTSRVNALRNDFLSHHDTVV